MQRKFLNNLILMVFLNLLVKPLAIFGIDAEVQNRIGAEEYGLYFSLLNFTYIFNIILDFGITNYNTKYVAQYPHLVKRYMGKILPLRFLLFFIYVLISVLLAVILGYEGRQFIFLGVLIFNQFLVSVIQYLRSSFAGLLLFRVDTLLSVMDRILLILIAGYLLYFYDDRHFRLSWFVGAQTVSYLVAVLFAVALVLWKIGIPKLNWSPAFNKVILRKSFPYALLILLMMLYNRIDAVMIERLHPDGLHQAGIYAQAFRLLDAFVMFGMLFSNLLFPMFSRLIKERMPVVSLLDSASGLLLGFSMIVAIACFAFPYQVLDLIYTQDIHEAVPTFRWVILSFIPISIVTIFGTLLTANGSLRTLNYVSFMGLLLNILLNLFFIRKWGAWGAAMATLITQSGVALIQVIFVWKYFQLRANIRLVLRYTGFTAWLLASCWLVPRLDLENPLNNILLVLLSGGIAFFIFGLVHWRILLSMFRKVPAEDQRPK